ncbi:hypothetical protein ACS0TY_000499 [Phlomoides rotata]
MINAQGMKGTFLFIYTFTYKREIMDKQIFLKGHCVMTIFATSCIFSDIFPVNSMLMNLAANVFYSSGVSSLTSQDALSLLDQVGIVLI